MSNEQLDRFRQLVWADELLQQQLLDAPDQSAFCRLAVKLGAALGCSFTLADVQRALHAGRRAWFEQSSVR